MNPNIEALEAKLVAATTAREKIDALNALAWALRDWDNRGQAHADLAFTLAQAENYPQGLAESLVNQCQYIFSDFVRALSLGSQALARFEQLGDRRGQARALFTLCWAYWFADDFVPACVSLSRNVVSDIRGARRPPASPGALQTIPRCQRKSVQRQKRQPPPMARTSTPN